VKAKAILLAAAVPVMAAADGNRYAFDLKSNGAVLVVLEM